jgi:hypothetical protein
MTGKTNILMMKKKQNRQRRWNELQVLYPGNGLIHRKQYVLPVFNFLQCMNNRYSVLLWFIMFVE